MKSFKIKVPVPKIRKANWSFSGYYCPKCSGRLIYNHTGHECCEIHCDYNTKQEIVKKNIIKLKLPKIRKPVQKKPNTVMKSKKQYTRKTRNKK